ncbi:MAG: aminoglycoside phosphotransferase family protein [Lautropia sp.]|nr:aminoglycoside phosphotransferase family protein [Lautropia sp.]
MLSPADEAVARRDPSLPGLGLLLDDEALTAALRQSAQGPAIARARIDYLRYKPATSCMATVRIEDGQGQQHHAFAKALPTGGRDWAWQRRRLLKRAQDDGAFSAHLIEEASLLLAAPEHDRRITALFQRFHKSRQQLGTYRHTSSPASPTRPLLLSPALSTLAAGHDTDHVDCQILRYKPERRLVARLQHDGQTLGLLRAFTHADYAATLASARLAQQLNGPALLAEDPSQDCFVTQWIEGKSLNPESTESAPTAHDFRDIGRLLAWLHQADIPHPIQRPRQIDIEAVRQAADTISLLHPELAPDARALQRRISDALRQADCPNALTHGDLSLEQIIREPSGTLRLIDWDSASIGSPAADFGSLLARLCFQEVQGILPAGTHQQALAQMLHHYRIPSSLSSDTFEKLIGWHTIAGLMRLMPEGFRKRRPHWLALMTRALSMATHMADQMDSTKRSSMPETTPADDELWPLQDASQMKVPLAGALQLSPDDFELQAVKRLRHKAGRRALLHYVLDFNTQTSWTLIGKWRAKGVDKHAFNIQRDFWQTGFDLPGLSVPEALAMLPEHRLWLQRHAKGEMATTLLGPDMPRELSARLGRAIASLHNTPVPTKRHWTLSDELGMLEDRLQQASRLRPAWASRIDNVMDEIRALAEWMPANPVTGIHRDCYADQILVDGEKLVWLDLDLYAEGDPALDVGNFIAHLIEHALRFHDNPNLLSAHQQVLQEAFLAHSRRAISPASIDAWITISLARHIFISTQFADRQHTTGTLIGLCEARLGRVAALSA